VFLGLDLGTSNVKAIVADSDGQVVSSGSAQVKTDYLPDGGVEQNIADICSAAMTAMANAAQGCDLGSIQAIGVSSQGGALQILGRNGSPVGPVISWMDSRSAPYNRRETASLGRDWFGAHAGHRACGTAVGQLLRLAEAGRLLPGFRAGFVGDQIVRRLCGRAAHDATSLSLAMLYNPSLGRADPGLLNRLGLSDERLPDLLSAETPAGTLLNEVAEETGLPRNIPVSPAVHDQYAAALGCGAVADGDVMFGAGTAWVLLAVTDRLPKPASDTAFVCRHPVEGLYGQILSLGNGGSAISWALAAMQLGQPDNDEMDRILSSAPPGCDGLRCKPLFASAGPGSSGAQLTGLRLSHKPAHIIRAVIEGLAFELAKRLEMLKEAGMGVQRLQMCGPAASGEVTPQIVCDVTGVPVERVSVADASALGAAVLARRLVQPDHSLEQISKQMAGPSDTVTVSKNRSLYASAVEQYLAESG